MKQKINIIIRMVHILIIKRRVIEINFSLRLKWNIFEMFGERRGLFDGRVEIIKIIRFVIMARVGLRTIRLLRLWK